MTLLDQEQEEAHGPSRPVKRLVVGRPMRTGQLEDTLLSKTLALPIFASDPLSSVAYATESALVVLLAVSASAAHFVFPIAIAIAALLAIVIASYRQTVRVYETSGGAYVVARENLGTLPSLTAAAALLTDYVLTVAVSISAGIFAITSFAPSLVNHKVALSLGCLLLIVLANLRGVRESGILFALPTYAFVTAIGVMIVAGLVELVTGHVHRAVVPHALPAGTGAMTLFVLLRAFSSGSTALTGVEAIANGVNAFRHPQGKNAATTLAVLGTIAITLFLGVSYLAVHVHAMPSSTDSVVSQIARAVFPAGSFGSFMYYAVQGLTLLVLILAANTSFQGFPRLSALLRARRFRAAAVREPRRPPRVLERRRRARGRGRVLALDLRREHEQPHPSVRDRRVHGVHPLAGRNGPLLVAPPRAEMAGAYRDQRARRDRDGGRDADRRLHEVRRGSVARHGRDSAARARDARDQAALPAARATARRRRSRRGRRPACQNTTLLVVESIDRSSDEALWFARAISSNGLRAVHVPQRGTDPGIRPRWFRHVGGEPLLEALSPDGGMTDAILEQVWRLPRGESHFVTVVVPEVFRSESLLQQFRKPHELALKLRLLAEPGVVVADVPVVEGRPGRRRSG